MLEPIDTARNMITRYGIHAEVHCTYSIIDNDGRNKRACDYWRAVYDEIIKLRKEAK